MEKKKVKKRTRECWHGIAILKNMARDFPVGIVVKNPPANAGDMGLISGPRRSHMPRSS